MAVPKVTLKGLDAVPSWLVESLWMVYAADWATGGAVYRCLNKLCKMLPEQLGSEP